MSLVNLQNAIKDEDISILEVYLTGNNSGDLNAYHAYTEFDLGRTEPADKLYKDYQTSTGQQNLYLPYVVLIDLSDMTVIEPNCSDYWNFDSNQSFEDGMQACLDQHR